MPCVPLGYVQMLKDNAFTLQQGMQLRKQGGGGGFILGAKVTVQSLTQYTVSAQTPGDVVKYVQPLEVASWIDQVMANKQVKLDITPDQIHKEQPMAADTKTDQVKSDGQAENNSRTDQIKIDEQLESDTKPDHARKDQQSEIPTKPKQAKQDQQSDIDTMPPQVAEVAQPNKGKEGPVDPLVRVKAVRTLSLVNINPCITCGTNTVRTKHSSY